MNKEPSARPSRRRERIGARKRQEAEARKRKLRKRTAWAAVGLVALLLIFNAFHPLFSSSASAGPIIDNIECNTNEQLVYHIHAHLTIYDQGQSVTVPQGIGIDQKDGCYYWMHTHDSTGVMHIESPSEKHYMLGNFLDIWGVGLDKTTFFTHGIDAQHSVRTYLGNKLYSGDPKQITLNPHTLITVEYGPPWVAPTAFKFPSNE